VASAARVDDETAEWVRLLAGTGPEREAAVDRLHAILVRIARVEAARRRPRLRISGPELDDLAYQAAADALMAITGKIGQFRGEGRFTTWAHKFVIFEVSAKCGRHFWRRPAVALNAEDRDRLPGRFGFDPAAAAEWGIAGRAGPCGGHRADPAAAPGLRRDRAERRPAGRAGHRAVLQPERDL